jgi:hypothetical protein
MNDVLLFDDDLMIADGDFVVGESRNQNISYIIRCRKGAFKQSPLIGYGEQRLLNGNLDGAARREIQLQLESDGIRVNEMKVDNGGLLIR